MEQIYNFNLVTIVSPNLAVTNEVKITKAEMSHNKLLLKLHIAHSVFLCSLNEDDN